MAEADAKNRLLADQIADLLSLILKRFGIAGAVRKENAVRVERQDVFGRCKSRHHGNAGADLHQTPQDVPLDPVIVGDDVTPGIRGVAYRFGRRTREYRLLPGVTGFG